jgi:nanoRNase/pAp phosphatase (c-di-AMP/oligoRNAs hydrolase)
MIMDFADLLEKLISTLKKYGSILICIKGSPDPDVIASSYALYLLCEENNIRSRITSPVKPSLPQNMAIVDDLGIPIHFEEFPADMKKYSGYCVLDFQSVYINGITGKIPCAVHIDHHDPLEEDIPIDFNLILEDMGSISTFFALIIREYNKSRNPLSESIQKKVSTALVYGIYIDTDAYRHAGHLDFDALHYVSNYSDKEIIEHITEIPMPKDVMGFMGKALRNKEEYKGWVFAGIGFIDEARRDSIAIIADFFVQRFKSQLVIVYAGIFKKKPPGLRLDASFRTEEENIDLNRLIKYITVSGGGRKYKGAYQVDLNYFADCPDKDLLWESIDCTTRFKLRRLRDELQFIEIKGIYRKIKIKINRIIK